MNRCRNAEIKKCEEGNYFYVTHRKPPGDRGLKSRGESDNTSPLRQQSSHKTTGRLERRVCEEQRLGGKPSIKACADYYSPQTKVNRQAELTSDSS
jgi:hypothetical protein